MAEQNHSDFPGGAEAWQIARDSLQAAFHNLRIEADVTALEAKGPLYRYTVFLKPGEKRQKIEKYGEQIAGALGAAAEPFVEQGRIDGLLSNDVIFSIMMGPHPVVDWEELAAKVDFKNPAILQEHQIPLLLGVHDLDQPVVLDLQKATHLLVAGMTGSGKSMLLHSFIQSILTHSDEQKIRLALVDPKLVEFSAYDDPELNPLRYEIVHTVDGAINIIDDLHATMEKRLAALSKRGCRDIIDYRAAGHDMPYIVLIIDELADLIRNKKSGFSEKLCALLAKCRAVGIHCIAATQHPSREVITGLLKAQFPTRIGCRVATGVHSKVVLDQTGAEKLMGKGDALLLQDNSELLHFRGPLVKMDRTARPSKNSQKEAAPKKSGWLLKLGKIAEVIRS